MEDFFQYVNPIKISVLLTMLYAFSGFHPNKTNHRYLLAILIISFLNEVSNSILLLAEFHTGTLTTISVVIHHCAWLLLLGQNVRLKKLSVAALACFVSAAVINFLFIEGPVHFNYYTFVTGAFLYLCIFIAESFLRLKEEDFSFFLSNDYLLLLAPVLFFFGMSLMFGFKSRTVTSTVVFGSIKLYAIVSYFVNILYYLFINLYIYHEKKLQNAV
ncbi:MAG TPA: hypothetical protein VGB50_00340 [Flavobacterium sp.]|jgi:hypothetical protein